MPPSIRRNRILTSESRELASLERKELMVAIQNIEVSEWANARLSNRVPCTVTRDDDTNIAELLAHGTRIAKCQLAGSKLDD